MHSHDILANCALVETVKVFAQGRVNDRKASTVAFLPTREEIRGFELGPLIHKPASPFSLTSPWPKTTIAEYFAILQLLAD